MVTILSHTTALTAWLRTRSTSHSNQAVFTLCSKDWTEAWQFFSGRPSFLNIWDECGDKIVTGICNQSSRDALAAEMSGEPLGFGSWLWPGTAQPFPRSPGAWRHSETAGGQNQRDDLEDFRESENWCELQTRLFHSYCLVCTDQKPQKISAGEQVCVLHTFL